MAKREIIVEMEPIFREVLGNETISLSEELTMDDVEEWDSIAHIELVSELSSRFKVKFSTEEMSLWENVGDIAESIAAKVNA